MKIRHCKTQRLVTSVAGCVVSLLIVMFVRITPADRSISYYDVTFAPDSTRTCTTCALLAWIARWRHLESQDEGTSSLHLPHLHVLVPSAEITHNKHDTHPCPCWDARCSHERISDKFIESLTTTIPSLLWSGLLLTSYAAFSAWLRAQCKLHPAPALLAFGSL